MADLRPPRAIDPQPFKGLRVLYLEDEAVIAMNVAETMHELGCIVHEYSTIAAALDGIEKVTYDIAVLDVNIYGRMSYDVAQAALDRGMPVAFLTGYAPEGLHPDWRGHHYCEKPFGRADIEAMIDKALAQNGSGSDQQSQS